MTPSELHDLQLSIEHEYSHTHAKKLILEAAGASEDIQERILLALQAVNEWAEGTYWPSKEARIKQFMAKNNVAKLVDRILVALLPLSVPVDFTAVVGPIAEHIDLVDTNGKQDTIMKVQTMSELVAVVSKAGLYDIIPASFSKSGHMAIRSNYQLPQALQEHLQNLIYLPPMLVPPKLITKNSDCGYLLDSDKNKGVVLKAINQHDFPLALDTINISNSVAYSLDPFVMGMEEVPSKPLDTPQKAVQFYQHTTIARRIYGMIMNTGNRFYLNHKFDKRGREFMAGHHVNLQSYEYKKASINLYKQETIPLDS